MDKVAICWGLLFGGIFGYLFQQLSWPPSAQVVYLVDMGYYGLMGVKLSKVIGEAAISTLMGMGMGALGGIVIGAGRTNF